jgi:hypothetical protein
MVKKAVFIFLLIFTFYFCNQSIAQCVMCARTAAQMGEKPARGLNGGILYLMAAPFLVVGVIGYRWWKSNGRDQS